MAIDPATLTTLSTALGSASAWAWGKYGDQLLEKAGGLFADWATQQGRNVLASQRWQGAAETYRANILKQHNFTRLLGKPAPVPLSGIFSDVYVLDRITARQRHHFDDLRNDPDRPMRYAERVAGLALIKTSKNRRLFVLGKPGAGKTTFLKYLLCEAAEGRLNRVPIFVSLKEWSDTNQALLPYLLRQFEICGLPNAQAFIEALLQTGEALLLLDGLDEVNAEGDKRSNITRQVREFVTQYAKTDCVVTCRNAAIPEFAFGSADPFSYVELADFTPTQVKTFISKWFSHNAVTFAKFEAAFYKDENKRLHELSNTPLLLSLLCLNFEGTLDFPPQRHEIYSEAIEVLLKRWDAIRSFKRDTVYKDLSLERKRQLLAFIAYQTFEKGELLLKQERLCELIVSFFERLNLTKLPDGEAMLKAIEAQHGLLIERTHHIYSFSHLTLHEYFAALYVKNAPTAANLQALLTMERILDSRWRELMLMVANMLADGDEWSKYFLAAIYRPLRTDKTLMAFWNWTYTKSQVFGKTLLYFYFALDHAFVPDLTRTLPLDFAQNLDHAFRLDIARAIDYAYTPKYTNHESDLELTTKDSDKPAHFLTHELSISRDTFYDHARTYTNSYLRTHAFALALNLNMICKFDLRLSLDLELIKDWILHITLKQINILNALRQKNIPLQVYLINFKILYKIICSRKLINDLTTWESNVPDGGWDKEKWVKFANNITTLLHEKRNLRLDWNFSEAQLKILADYFQGATFFLECLELANLSPAVRAHIKANLLNPPPVPAPVALPPFNRPALRQILSSRYNLDELDILAFDLDINSDEIKGDTLSSKAIALISHCERNNLLQALSDAIRAERKDIA